MEQKPDIAIFHLLIVLFWSLILRLVVYSETNYKGIRKFLNKYRMKKEITRFQQFTALYLLRREVKVSFLVKVTIVVFISGIFLLSCFSILIMYNLWDSNPAIINHFQKIAIWFNYLSIALIFIIQIISRFIKGK